MSEEEKKETLKVRRNKRSALTRSLNILKSATTEKNEKEVIENALERLQIVFKQVEEIHDALVELIIDDQEFDEAEKYMLNCQREFTEGLQIATKYLAEVNEKVRGNETDELKGQDETQDAHAVAKFMLKKDLVSNGLVKFDDDPINYRQWKATFKGVIQELELSPREEADLLIRWLGTKSTRTMMRLRAVYPNHPAEGLKALWDRLDEEYGAPEIIEGLLISKLDTFPKIGRDQPTKLKEFADLLCELEAAKHDEALSGLALFDTYRGVSMAVEKLPFSVQEAWRTTGSKYKEERQVSFPPFSVFVEFVCKQSKIRNDPSFKLVQTQTKNTQGQPKSTQVKSFSTASYSKPKSRGCMCCSDENHSIIQCDKFKAMTLVERDNVIKIKGLCRGCLKRGHIWKNCQKRQICDVCKGQHPTVLHRFQNKECATNTPQNLVSDEKVHTIISHCNSTEGTSQGNCVSSVIPVLVTFTQSEETLTYAVLDEQSDACFITESLKNKLGARGTKVDLEIATILDRGTVSSEKFKGISVRGLNQNEAIKLPAAYAREKIPISIDQIPTPEKMNGWPHLQSMACHLSPLLNVEVGLLIGANCSKALMPLEVIPGNNDNDPYAVRTALGWGVIGVIKKGQNSPERKHFAFKSTTREVIKVLENDFLDERGRDIPMSADDVQFMKKMDEGLKTIDGRIQLPLPFKVDQPKLPNNREVALKRLIQLKHKLMRNPEFAEKYKKFMSDVMSKGQAEIVPVEEKNNPCWYIPHHGVFHPRKQEKLRVVMDCASRHLGVSLNDYLLQGPNLTNNLIGVLMRFRKEPIAFVGDVEGMFYQVLVEPRDRDFLRFLWWSDDNFDKVTEYRMRVHVFGAASSPGCANYALKKVADMNKDQFGIDAAEFVQRGFYVDDGLKSVSTVEGAISLITRTAGMLEKGGFRLHKFLSNSPEVLNALPAKSVVSNVCKLDLSNLPTERTLGILWNAGEDIFTFDATPKNKPATRRGILSTVSAIFDPLGLVGPYVLTGKQILQTVCANGADWDDPVEDVVMTKWNAWKEQLPLLHDVKIERCYQITNQPSKLVTVELHHFCDASERGYGQCSYMRVVDEHDRVKVTLLMSKCRVAPLKMTTIPRLELVAATVSVKIATLLREELEYENVIEHFWTDSQVVLGYIRNDAKRFHTFVANRVQQIRNNSRPEQWHYIPTQQNPADIASRGLNVSQLKDCNLWWHGPEFLNNKNYKIEQTTVPSVNDNDVEVRKVTVCVTGVKSQFISDVLQRLSSWTKARRVFAMCLIFGQKLKGVKRTNDITIEDLARAESIIIKHSQQNEYNNIRQLEKLDPIKDDNGLIRVGGRLRKSEFAEEIKHPVILPNKGDLTRLIVRHYHQLAYHQGRGITLNTIRSAGYWIVGGARAVARYIHDCVVCRKLRRQPEYQKMADLPSDRLQPSAAFSYCGADLFGPIFTKNGRKQEKRYGVLFTCLVSRGVHLEIANSLSTDSFMNAFRRFICRRGPIMQIRTDQGSNFVGASRELKEAMKEMNQEEISSEMMKYNVRWIFNTPSASHHGGAWERMIRMTRNILDSMMLQHKGQLTDEMLTTFMTEAEAIINSRPLCTTTDASVDPLTPALLLTLKTSAILPPPGNFQRDGKFSRKLWRRVQHICEVFWTRWRKEYISSLHQRQKWNKARRNATVGDVVLLCDENVPRNQWELARIIDVKLSDDGLVRSVTLYCGRRKTTLDRPVGKIILLIPEEQRVSIPSKSVPR